MEARKRQLHPRKGSDQPSDRFMAAVMFTEVVGFTALMQKDEAGTLARMDRTRELLERIHAGKNGRVLQYFGDGCLSVFQSVSNALACARQIQEEHDSSTLLPVSIGIHLGEMVEKDSSVYGDGVRLASLIESAGVAGSVVLSEEVYRQVRSQETFHFVDLGLVKFVNVEEPMHLYALQDSVLRIPTSDDLADISVPVAQTNLASRLPWGWIAAGLVAIIFLFTQLDFSTTQPVAAEEVTSLGVLPFDLQGEESNQSPFILNLSSDITLKLGEQHGLKVLHSDAAKDLKQSMGIDFKAAKKMGLTHLLSGELNRDAEDIYLEVDLVDTKQKASIWSKVYQKKSQDLLMLKDELAADILKPLALEENTFHDDQIANLFPTLDEGVLRQFLSAQQSLRKKTSTGVREAIMYLDACVDQDSSFALGYATLAECYAQLNELGEASEDAIVKAGENVGLAYRYNRNLPEAYAAHALMNLSFDVSDPEEITELCQQAIQLRPSYDMPYEILGRTLLQNGDYENAQSYLQIALELNPDKRYLKREISTAKAMLLKLETQVN